MNSTQQPRMTLGARLRANLVEEHLHPIEAARKKAAEKGAEAVAQLKAAEEFFERVKTEIANVIMAGTSPKPIRLSYHEESALGTLYWDQKKPTLGKDSLAYPVFDAFDKWTKDEELEYKFVYGWDGGGMHSWWDLVVKVPQVANAH